jgi:TRAP transporter TAXI family solute receptor
VLKLDLTLTERERAKKRPNRTREIGRSTLMHVAFTKTILAGAVTGLAIAANAVSAQAQQAIRIGTSSTGSVFYTIAVGAGEVINKHAKVNTTVESVGGSSANVVGLGAKKVEFAVANAFAAFSGYRGRYQFKNKVDIRLVLQAQTSNRYLVALKSANIKTPKDLEGKTVVGKRRALPEIDLVMEAFVKSFDLKNVKVVATSNTPGTLKALSAGSVQAAIMPFSARAAQVEKPSRDGLIEFVYISKEKRDEMLKTLPEAFFGATLKPKTFTGQDKPLHVFSLNTYFIARPDVSEDVVYKVTKALADNTKELSTYHRTGRFWTAERALSNFALPFHPGAIKYFKEKGLWTAAHEAKQTELLKN